MKRAREQVRCRIGHQKRDPVRFDQRPKNVRPAGPVGKPNPI
jgi:hypothetical protein